MSVDAIVKDGSVINQSGAASNSENKAVEKMNDYKEQFMSLLVAQMKYQDPLEPTSNTEYISQYAQFTQVEQMQNMADAMTLNRASEMVGKTVQIEDTNDDGVKFIKDTGKVDYVTYSAGDAYVHVNGNSYKVSQVSSVLDDKYYSDVETSDEIRNMMKKLPDVQSLTLSSQADLESLLQAFNSLTTKPGILFEESELKLIDSYANRYAELLQTAYDEASREEAPDEEKGAISGVEME